MKKSIILYIVAGVIIAASVVKIFMDRRKSHALQSAISSPVILAEGFIVCDTLVNFELNTIGSMRAYESVDMESEISKRLVSVNFKEGTFVKKGTLLFKLDDADLKAMLERLIIQEELASQNEQRNKTLLEKGGLSQQVYDEVLNNLLLLRADIKLINVELDKTEIRAPFSGKIGLRNVSEGAFVTPDRILTTLQDIYKLRIDFSIPERYANSIMSGMKITFTVSGNPCPFTATIKAVQPNIDVDTRNIRIMAVADNSDGLLFPGSSVKVFLDFQETEKSIFVPSQSLLPSLKGYNVYIVSKGKARMSNVKTGIRTKENVQLLEGVKIGDTLVMTNLLRIKPGSYVMINKLN